MSDQIAIVGQEFSIGPTGLIVIGRPTFESWERLGHALKTVEQGIQFAIGDYLRLVEEYCGERASQIIDSDNGWSLETCRVYRWVAEKVQADNRMPRLSFSHHQAVASLTSTEQRAWLEKALAGDEPWTVKQLTDAMKADGIVAPIIGWLALVTFTSEKERRRVTKIIELEGAVVKAIDKRKKAKPEAPIVDQLDSEQEPARVLPRRHKRKPKAGA